MGELNLLGCVLFLSVLQTILLFLILKEMKKNMSTTNQGLAALNTDLAQLKTDNATLLAGLKALLANQQPGLQPGQVIVNQADIDAADAIVKGIDSDTTAADATLPAGA